MANRVDNTVNNDGSINDPSTNYLTSLFGEFRKKIYQNRWKVTVGGLLIAALIGTIVLFIALHKGSFFKADKSLSASGKMAIASAVIIGGSGTALIGIGVGFVLSRRPVAENPSFWQDVMQKFHKHENTIGSFAIVALMISGLILGAILLINGLNKGDLTEQVTSNNFKLTPAGIDVFAGCSVLGTAITIPLAVYLGWLYSKRQNERVEEEVRDCLALDEVQERGATEWNDFDMFNHG